MWVVYPPVSSVVQMTPEVCSNEVSQSGRILDKCARADQSHHNQLIVSFPPRHHQRAGQVRQRGLSSPPPPDRGAGTRLLILFYIYTRLYFIILIILQPIYTFTDLQNFSLFASIRKEGNKCCLCFIFPNRWYQHKYHAICLLLSFTISKVHYC